MAKKLSNNKDNKKATASIGFSSKGKKAPTPKEEPKKEKLTKKQIIILVAVLLIAVITSGVVIGAVFAIRRINDPDFMKSDLSRYISIAENGYKGYTINIALDEFSEADVEREINKLITSKKTLNEQYKGRYPINNPLSLGDTVRIYYRGYTVGEDGRETDFDGSSNFADSVTVLEVGTGNVINADTGAVSGSFIGGFGEGLVGKIPGEYSEFKTTTSGRVMAGDVIYLSYTVIGGKDGVNKTVTNERIDLALPYIDELYGKGFTEFFTGKVVNGEASDFKNIGEDLDKLICRIGDSQTDTVYSDMKIEFVTRGCENNPITISVRFPANYQETTLRGKDAFFDVYVDSATVYDTPVFDDKFITETLKVDANTLDSYAGATLTEKYRAKVREELKTQIEESNHELLISEMWKFLNNHTIVKKLPKKTVEYYYNSYYNTIASYYQNYSQSYPSIDAFAIEYLKSSYGANLGTGDDWKAYVMKLAENDVTEKLIFYYIIREENLIPPESEYEKIYNKIYNEVFDYYFELNKEKFEKLEGEAYDKEINVLKSEIDGSYGDEYFKEQTYYYYCTRKMLEFANITK